jgi:hypothetical protein
MTMLRIDAARRGGIDDRAYVLCRFRAARRARDLVLRLELHGTATA